MFWSRRKPDQPSLTSAEGKPAPRSGLFGADNPVRTENEDLLGRTPLAKAFAAQVLSLDSSQGAVVGVLGAWGSGKTSFVNLARERLSKDAEVLDFNPWMFSGAEQLVDHFFIELSAQLGQRRDLEDIGDEISQYGESLSGLGWIPVAGPWLERGKLAADLISTALKRRKEGVSGRRQKLEEKLARLSRPIVVVLDDIDRLSTQEVRDVFKLVRLTASFPNVVYVLAFDRFRVESALSTDGIPGRDYLEKILQIAVDLPALPEEVLTRHLFTQIDAGLEGIENPGNFDQEAWPDLVVEVIRPLIDTPRDVRRLAAAVRGTVLSLGGRVALADVIALEAIRIFLPDVFVKLQNSVDALTTTESGFGGREREDLKADVEALVKSSGNHESVIRAAIQRLFPAGSRYLGGSTYLSDWSRRWLREGRVAHEHLLRFYLEKVAGEGLTTYERARHAAGLLNNAEELDKYLRSLAPESLERVIGGLETYEEEFQDDQAVPGAVVLLNLMADIPERPRGMFEFGKDMVVGRVVYRLIRRLPNAEVVEASVRAIIPQLRFLSSELDLLDKVGYRQNSGHKLVSEDAAAALEREWRDRVRAASIDRLLLENELLLALYRVKNDSKADEPQLVLPESNALTLTLLRQARTETRSQYAGSRAVRRSYRLAWKVLTGLFDDETLNRRIATLRKEHKGDEDLFELVDKYFSGNPPSDD